MRAPQIAASLFEEPKAGYVLLAWNGEQLVGMAAYSFLWLAAGVTCSLYLKELYVAGTSRRKGVDRLLMRRLCQLAAEHECSRIEWTADEGTRWPRRSTSSSAYRRTKTKRFTGWRARS